MDGVLGADGDTEMRQSGGCELGDDLGRPPAEDQVAGALGEGHHRCLGVRGRDRREDARVDDAQPVEPVHAQFRVDHCSLVESHPAPAGHVREALCVGMHPFGHLIVVQAGPKARAAPIPAIHWSRGAVAAMAS
jgi:hypothetical protein